MAGNGDSMPTQFADTDATSPAADEAQSSNATSNHKLRKRTKTGCLTCRKRRIKCGEERPTCNNCIKSKRHCEGYNQRVIFKPPLGDWPGMQQGTAGTIPYHNGMLPAATPYARAIPPPINTQDAGFTPLQPRLVNRTLVDENGQPVHFGPLSTGMAYMGVGPMFPLASPQTPIPPTWTPITPQYGHHMFPPQESPMLPPQESPRSASTHHSMHSQIPTPLGPPVPYLHSPNIDHNWQRAQQLNSTPIEPPTPASPSVQDYKPSTLDSVLPTPCSSVQSQDGDQGHFSIRPPNGTTGYWEPTGPGFNPANNDLPVQYPPQSSSDLSFSALQTADAEPFMHSNTSGPTTEAFRSPAAPMPHIANASGISFIDTAADFLEQAAVEYEDNDYYDVHSDEEMDIPLDQTVVKLQETQRDFGMIMDLHRQHTSELSMRRYDTFIYDGILDHYRAEWVANPLRNPKTARVFAHFIFATGPTLSIYERHPRNASAMFGDWPVPNHQQGLWTYALPMMALNHQGLLHAMLALASLHIAKLQGASVTPSYKHYAYALKRIHHCVGNGKKRHFPTTIAATLLLGFYEVMTADHLKWSSHLAGAKQLLVEIDFQGMTKEYRRIKAERAAHEQLHPFDDSENALQERNPNRTFKDLSPAIDEGLVSTLLGRKLRYDEFGRVIEDNQQPNSSAGSVPPPLDTAKYELYQDLYWWYGRQDVYQAIVSGNRLLLDYGRWADCPPRASMGRADAVYGTHDHLILLLGRIADFGARDRSRKIKVLEANGGQWRPPPHMDFGSPTFGRNSLNPAPPGPPGLPAQGLPQSRYMPQAGAQAPPQSQQQSKGPPPAMPTFFGMAPMPTKAHMPSSYAVDGASSTPSPRSDRSDYDLEIATQSALDEWFQIRTALNTFKSHFGPQFQPLSPEFHQPSSTPFGPALQYRSYDIAVLWALYYMSYIIALRSHPHMPPAAMMAAGIAAPQTAPFAQIIGQIAGGIVPPHPGQPLNPSLGASLCEVSMPLFFAGIQFQDAAQRNWTVRHIRDIEARTGWASIGMIAQGCETAWVKAFEAGRGPPYARTKEEWHVETHDNRVTREGGHFDGLEPDPSDLTDRRWTRTNAATRVHWAMGLLSVEEDIDGGASRRSSGIYPSVARL